MIIGLCDRWHKLPEEIEAADAGLIGMLEIIRRGTPEEV
jgi:hypothetical protein